MFSVGILSSGFNLNWPDSFVQILRMYSQGVRSLRVLRRLASRTFVF